MFCAWFAIALASEKAAQECDHACGLLQAWRLVGRNRVLGNVGTEGLPFGVLEEHGARDAGRLPTKPDQMKDTPGDDHIQDQTRFNAVGAG